MEINLGTVLFVATQYMFVACVERVLFAVTGVAALMTPTTTVIYYVLLYLLCALHALEEDED